VSALLAQTRERTINRYYDHSTGQFVSVDPMVNETNQPYTYAGDDPVNGVDPSGLDATEVLYEQGSRFADAAATNPGYFNYGSFNDLSTVIVNAINAPFVSIYNDYDNIYHAGQDGCSLTTAVALTGDALAADVSAGFYFDGGGEAVDAAAKLLTEADQAVFWSGVKDGSAAAERWAAKNGGATLEGTASAQGLNLPAWDANNPESISAWRQASADFASGAQGNVTVLQGDSIRVSSIWAQDEYPALIANPNVTSITAVDPQTGATTLLWSRP
jgi:uncharacterized protein RhaS with RHS repeats